MFISDSQKEYHQSTTARERKRDLKKDQAWAAKQKKKMAKYVIEEELSPEQRLKAWLKGEDVELL